MSNTFEVDTLDYVEKSGAALARAQELVEAITKESHKIASTVPSLVDNLVSHGLINPNERKLAKTKLSSHTQSLELVGNLLNILEQTKQAFAKSEAVAGLGKGISQVRTKDASAKDLSTGGYVGRHRGNGEVRESDLACAAQLGIAL